MTSSAADGDRLPGDTRSRERKRREIAHRMGILAVLPPGRLLSAEGIDAYVLGRTTINTKSRRPSLTGEEKKKVFPHRRITSRGRRG